MRRFVAGLFLLIAVTFGIAAADAPYEAGDRMTEIVLDDQHGVATKIDTATRQVLFTRDMDAGDVVKGALAQNGARLLEDSGTVYVADISGMPALIRRLFALPKMRKRGYSMLLDVEGEATRRIPGRMGRATLVSLDELEIVEFRFLFTEQDVRAALTPVEVDPR